MIELDPALTESRRTAHEIVRDALRQAILRGSLKGGTRLVQADIANRLSISTTPVREALRDLATEGLITLDPHRGAVVTRLFYDDIREIHDICKLLEPEAVRRAAEQANKAELARARELADQMEGERDVGRWADLNRQFHAALVEDVDAPRLISMLKGLWDSAAPYVGMALMARPQQIKEANTDHGDLLQAVEQGKPDLAAEIAQRHVNLTIRGLEDARETFDAPAEVPTAS